MKGLLLIVSLAIALMLIGCVIPVVEEPEPEPVVEEPESEPMEPLPNIVRTVGAHYFPWYYVPYPDSPGGRWSSGSPSTPVLGDYNSTDTEVIEQHINWAHAAGITWLNVSWDGENSFQNRALKTILDHPLADELQWSILYETQGRFREAIERDGWVCMDDPANQYRLCEDLQYLAETYFGRDLYMRIDGRPVLYIYAAPAFRGDVAAAYEYAVNTVGVRPYLIVDIPRTWPLDANTWGGWGAPIIEVADAVTTFSAFPPDEDEDVLLDRLESAYEAWYLAEPYVDIDIILPVQPGFDKTQYPGEPPDGPTVNPSPGLYRQVAQTALRYARGPILVYSFNEWFEDSQIEPSVEFGDAYLQITADILATGEREPPTIEGAILVLVFEQLVPEIELNPDIDPEDSRNLAMLVERLVIRNVDGQIIADIDVGGNEGNTRFLLGGHFKEHTDGETWRWFGGSGKTVIYMPEIPESGSLEIHGRAATRMSVELMVEGEVRGEAMIDTRFDIYSVEF